MRNWLKYKFDQVMAKGMHAQLTLLALLGVLFLVGATALMMFVDTDISYWGQPMVSVQQVLWINLLHILDPTNLVFTRASGWVAAGVFLVIAVAGLFTVGALIGIITAWIEDRTRDLRKGRSKVVERDHLVILGWDNRVPGIVSGLAIAHEIVDGKKGRARIAVLANRDLDQTEEELEDVDLKTSSLILRRGNPLDPEDLHIVSACSGRCIIIPAPISTTGDAQVIKTLLALNNYIHGCLKHVVAELSDNESYELARSISPDVNLVCADEIVSKVIAQSVLEPGLTEVYQTLFSFSSSEFYKFEVKDSHVAMGIETFGDLLLSSPTQIPVGLSHPDGTMLLPPDWDEPVYPGVRVITLSMDDVGLQVSRDRQSRRPEPVDPAGTSRWVERVLVYAGQNKKLPLIRSYLEARGVEIEVREYPACISNEKIDHQTVILLSEDIIEAQASDAVVMTQLLKLRNRQLTANIVAEILEPENVELMWAARADDCVASYQLSSSVLTQASYHPELLRVISRLLDERGVRLKIRPVCDYMETGSFQRLTVQAMARGEIALGYFPNELDAPVINPSKGTVVPGEGKAILLEQRNMEVKDGDSKHCAKQ